MLEMVDFIHKKVRPAVLAVPVGHFAKRMPCENEIVERDVEGFWRTVESLLDTLKENGGLADAAWTLDTKEPISPFNVAAKIAVECGGGLCAVLDGKVLTVLPLPIAGLMSDKPVEDVAEQLKKTGKQEENWR